MSTEIVLAGVGGQGIILAARLVSEAALLSGYDVKTSEVHGMSQRGGSVLSMVRFSESVASPLIPRGSATHLVSFEYIEGLRAAEYMRCDSTAIINELRRDPLPVQRGDSEYPQIEDIEKTYKEISEKAFFIKARSLAEKAGEIRTMSVVLIGALSANLDIQENNWKSSIENNVKIRFREVNMRAFELGRRAVGGLQEIKVD